MRRPAHDILAAWPGRSRFARARSEPVSSSVRWSAPWPRSAPRPPPAPSSGPSSGPTTCAPAPRRSAPTHPRIAAEACSDIVLVHVSEEDLRDVERNLKVPFPWPRALYGYLTEHIAAGKPKAIIFDWLFQGRGVSGADDADQFAGAMKQSGCAV